MKKFLVLSILNLLFFSNIAFAKNVSDDFIKKFASHYNAASTLSAEFTQHSYVEMIQQSLTKKGILQTVKPRKIRIEYLTEPLKIYVSDGLKLWVLDPAAKRAREFSSPETILSEEALSFLAGLGNLEDLFDILPDSKQPKAPFKIENKNLKILALVPKNPESDILRITLGINPQSLQVAEAVLFNTSGNTTHYKFDKIILGDDLAVSLFELPKKPKYKIVKKGL